MSGKQTLIRGATRLLLCAAVAAGAMASLFANDGGVDLARLMSIKASLTDQMGVVTIESSQPVPYVTSRPDAHTLVLELRDVDATEVVDAFARDPRHPVTAVAVESAVGVDGAAVARIRLSLADDARPRVRSSRNVIHVETLRALGTSTRGIAAAGPAVAIRDLRIARRDGATELTLLGTGVLPDVALETGRDGSFDMYFDLPNVTSSLPLVTPVDLGAVNRVRIGLRPENPLMTRVALELSELADVQMVRSSAGDEITLVVSDLTAQGAIDIPVVASALPPRPVAATAAPVATTVGSIGQAPVMAQAGAAQAPPAGAAQFTGEPVSFDFEAADLRAVLRTFADISGLNIVLDTTIDGTVDVSLTDVPWDQALDIILRANRLGYTVDGTIVRIAPLTVLAEEEQERAALAAQQALAGELELRTLALSYARADEFAPLLTQTVLSSRGSIEVDVRTNTLIINDLPERLERAVGLIATLDVPQPQVEIEARIVQTTREYARSLGVQWGGGAEASGTRGNEIPLAFPNDLSINTATNLAVASAASTIGVALGSINGALNLDAALSALERSGQGRLLSTPRVTTQNNVEAEITQGVQIPIQTVANNTVTVSFQDAALTLRVTPQITAAGTVIMRISVENASPDFSRSVNNIPPIDTQRATTQVLVSDGETTVIGGIYVSQEQAFQDRTPGLHRIPLLGWLFRRDEVTDQSRELLIFITPRILKL